ncbi:MAG: hypothetical protein K2Q25_12975 [Mycobacteriaceae bacterium]|nr:hypothetical protein [Mycobacteriaceae bacterium]
MVGLSSIAMGAAPIFGGALLGASTGQLKAPDLRNEINRDLELLDRLPAEQVVRREALRHCIDDRIDDLIATTQRKRQMRTALSGYEGNWRDIYLMLSTVLFTIVWWNVDHRHKNWAVLFIVLLFASALSSYYVFRRIRRTVLSARHHHRHG